MSQDRLDLEELAAFIEGRLKGEARARVVRLLAESEDAYEVFAETLRFQTEERAREAREVRSPSWRWALVLAQYRWLRPPQQEVLSGASLMREFGLSPDASARREADWDRHPWSPRQGGAERLGEPELAFRLGVRSADLAAALRLSDYTAGQRLAEEIVELLKGVAFSQPAASRYVGLRAGLERRESLQPLLETAEEAERSLARLVNSPRFDLGRWCGAASLAVSLRNSHLFRSAATRGFLARVDQLGLSPLDVEALWRIAALTSGDMDEAGYRELQALLDAIIQRNAG